MTARRALARLVWSQRGRYGLDAALTTARWLLVLAPAALVRDLLDALAAGAAPPWGVAGAALLLLAAELARVGATAGAAVANATAAFRAKALPRTNLLELLLTRPGAAPVPSGDAVARFRDDADLLEIVASAAIARLGQAAFAVAAVGLLLWVDPVVAAAALLPVALVIGTAQLAGHWVGEARRASRTAAGRVAATLAEALHAVEAIRAAGAEGRVLAHLDAAGEARRLAGRRDRLLGEAIGTAASLAAALGTGLALLAATGAVRAGAVTVGDVAFIILLLGPVAEATGALGGLLAADRQARVSWGQLAALAPAPPAALLRPRPVHLDGPLPAVPVPVKTAADRLERLDVAGLTCRHPASGQGIEGVSFSLVRGSLTVVTGRVGAGKTTLLRAVLGLQPADAGEVRWNGVPVADPAAWFVPPRCASTPQSPRLFSATLRDNILLGLPEERADLAGAARAAVLERDLAALPAGLDTVIGPRGARLSGGQAQRAAAARMFVAAPELVVVDDLSSALDAETERALWERLAGRRDVTCLAVSHRAAALARADQILVLEAGRLLAAGRPADLLHTCPELRRIWRGAGTHADAATHEGSLGTKDR